MAKRGGKRPRTGRPKGSGNKGLAALRDVLAENREALLRKAISMALAGDRVVLAALLRKVVPDLQAITVDGSMSMNHSTNPMSLEDARKLFLSEAGKAFTTEGKS